MLFFLWNHPLKFGNHSHCGGGGTTYLICHVTLQEHVIEGSYGALMKVISTLYVTTLQGFGHCGSGLWL